MSLYSSFLTASKKWMPLFPSTEHSFTGVRDSTSSYFFQNFPLFFPFHSSPFLSPSLSPQDRNNVQGSSEPLPFFPLRNNLHLVKHTNHKGTFNTFSDVYIPRKLRPRKQQRTLSIADGSSPLSSIYLWKVTTLMITKNWFCLLIDLHVNIVTKYVSFMSDFFHSSQPITTF